MTKERKRLRYLMQGLFDRHNLLPGKMAHSAHEGEAVPLVSQEFRKAFDAISHSTLLEKVAAHGRGTLWVQNWLWGWAQRVMESGVTSSWQAVMGARLPRCQHWGLFCLISVSAIWKNGSGIICQFVDDTNLVRVLVCFRKVLQGTGWIDGLRTKV